MASSALFGALWRKGFNIHAPKLTFPQRSSVLVPRLETMPTGRCMR
jgi:hypothetical protein